MLHFCLTAIVIIMMMIIIVVHALVLECSVEACAVIIWVRQMASQFGSGATCGRMTQRTAGPTDRLRVTPPPAWGLLREPGCHEEEVERKSGRD